MSAPQNQFGQTLADLIETRHKSGRAFSKISGVDSSSISRLISGEARCSREMLHTLCTHISPDPAEQFTLLTAHLWDEASHSGLDLSRITIRRLDKITTPELNLTPKLNTHLGVIARAAFKYPHIRKIVEALAAFVATEKSP